MYPGRRKSYVQVIPSPIGAYVPSGLTPPEYRPSSSATEVIVYPYETRPRTPDTDKTAEKIAEILAPQRREYELQRRYEEQAKEIERLKDRQQQEEYESMKERYFSDKARQIEEREKELERLERLERAAKATLDAEYYHSHHRRRSRSRSCHSHRSDRSRRSSRSREVVVIEQPRLIPVEVRCSNCHEYGHSNAHCDAQTVVVVPRPRSSSSGSHAGYYEPHRPSRYESRYDY